MSNAVLPCLPISKTNYLEQYDETVRYVNLSTPMIQEIPEGKRKQHICTQECQPYVFQFKSKEDNKMNCVVFFCPKEIKSNNITTFPQYNNDGEFFTSGFTLKVDQKTLERNKNGLLEQHNRQVQLSEEEKNIFVFPKPRKNKNCSICDQEFKSYFKHITSQRHKMKLLESQYHRLIRSLTDNFQHLQDKDLPSPFSIVKIQGQNNGKDSQKQVNGLVISSGESIEVLKQYPQKQSQFRQQQSSPRVELKSYKIQSSKQKKSIQCSQELNSDKEAVHLEQSSDQVEIIAVKPAKMKIKTQQSSLSKDKKTKKHKKTEKQLNIKSHKKYQEQRKQKKQKHKKEKKQNKQKKHKKKHSNGKYFMDFDSDFQEQEKRKSSVKRRSLDSVSTNNQKKVSFKGSQKPAHPPNGHQSAVLIEKSQKKEKGKYQGGEMDKQTEVILKNIICSISKSPPASAPRQYRRAGDFMDNRYHLNNRISVSSVTNQQNLQNKSYVYYFDRQEKLRTRCVVPEAQLYQKNIQVERNSMEESQYGQRNGSIWNDPKDRNGNKTITVQNDDDGVLSQTRSFDGDKGYINDRQSFDRINGSQVSGVSQKQNPSVNGDSLKRQFTAYTLAERSGRLSQEQRMNRIKHNIYAPRSIYLNNPQLQRKVVGMKCKQKQIVIDSDDEVGQRQKNGQQSSGWPKQTSNMSQA